MILGRVESGEETVRLEIDIRCTACDKKVPGGIRASVGFSRSPGFLDEIESLRASYLCGICRDRKRIGGGKGTSVIRPDVD